MIWSRTHVSILFSFALVGLVLATCYLPEAGSTAQSSPFVLAPRFSALDFSELEDIELELWVLPSDEVSSDVESRAYGDLPSFSASSYSSLLSGNRAAHQTTDWNESNAREFSVVLHSGTYHIQLEVAGMIDGDEQRYLGASWLDWNDLPRYFGGQSASAVSITSSSVSEVDLDMRNVEELEAPLNVTFSGTVFFADDPAAGATVSVTTYPENLLSEVPAELDGEGGYTFSVTLPTTEISIEVTAEDTNRTPDTAVFEINGLFGIGAVEQDLFLGAIALP